MVFNINAQTNIQTRSKFQGSTATTISQNFTSSSTDGNLIVVHLTYDNQNRSISTVTDTKGNKYQKIQGPTNWRNEANVNNRNRYRSELWYAYNIKGGVGNISITAVLDAAPTSYLQIYMSEFSGIRPNEPLDQHAVKTGNANNVYFTDNVTTTFEREFVYAITIGSNGNISSTGNEGFTVLDISTENVLQYKTVESIGTYNASFRNHKNDGSNYWVTEIATFKAMPAPLDIELSSFAGVCVDNGVKLLWTTATEHNNDYFTIQKSINGIEWREIGIVKGAGSSHYSLNYQLMDQQRENTDSYYRLNQTDFDGTQRLKQTISVKYCNFDEQITIFPNPSNGQFFVNFVPKGNYTIDVLDMSGKQIWSGQNATHIDLEKYQSGVYFINIQPENGETVVKRVSLTK